MRITYDKDADAAYLYFREIGDGEVAQTIVLSDSINIDIDKEGKTLGIEILFVSERMPKDFLQNIAVENLS